MRSLLIAAARRSRGIRCLHRKTQFKESSAKRFPATNSPANRAPNAYTLHIVVVGGGVAGLILATRLGHSLGRRHLARISLIDRSWVHVWEADAAHVRRRHLEHPRAAGARLAHARAHHFDMSPGSRRHRPAQPGEFAWRPCRRQGRSSLPVETWTMTCWSWPSAAAQTILPRLASSNTATSSTARTEADAFNARLRALLVRELRSGRRHRYCHRWWRRYWCGAGGRAVPHDRVSGRLWRGGHPSAGKTPPCWKPRHAFSAHSRRRFPPRPRRSYVGWAWTCAPV